MHDELTVQESGPTASGGSPASAPGSTPAPRNPGRADQLDRREGLGRLGRSVLRPASVVCLMLVAAVIATGFAVRSSTAETGILIWIDVHHTPALDGVAWALSWAFESPRAIAVVVLLAAGVAWRRRHLIDGLCAGIALALTWGTSYLVKLLVGRHRPAWTLLRHHVGGPEQDPSFPSGHATFTTALVVVVVMCTRRGWRVWIGAVGCVLAAGVAASRLYLGVHYPSDVAAGIVYGAAAGYLMFRATTLVSHARPDRRAGQDEDELRSGPGEIS
ncbi:MAG: phosphatase PAP2 family protein [Propionicimonas sp.]|uniref:phosphatase PAP2 family protein n=2 Tax=Actinomycetes TaxID=1760 RepID=UPI00110AA1DF|nr:MULTISPECIES: phosphatase PAP2 family protein [Propionibacteriaceae]MDK9647035.1 phosphatase PAP2 family protein [Propionibacterium freudenreichii]MEA5053712.1 phosphatase PAP2 family protein [Propionicimonas sp.]QCV88642.1 phosphatase PAP2 family protein [Acidipropionibacterium jensenii]